MKRMLKFSRYLLLLFLIFIAGCGGGGSSAGSGGSNSQLSAIAPGAPAIGTATAGNTQAAVTFTAPGSDGGSAITSYMVTSSPGNITATGATSPIMVSGLTNGTSYTFTVKATNAVGTSPASAPSNSVTPGTGTVPGAPAIGTATAGNAQATVTFTAPGSDGGSAITGYTVTSSPGNITTTGSASPITVSGLTNGTTYTFTVTATNLIGTSSASAPSNSVTPTAPVVPWQVSGVSTPVLNYVATDGNIVIATGKDGANAFAVGFNSDGTIRWQNESLHGVYGKSQVANGNLYAIRSLWSGGVDYVYVDKIDVNTGSIITAVAGTVSDLYGINAPGGSLAVSANAIYVAATDGSAAKMTFSKFDLALNSKTNLFVYSGSLSDMDVSVAGNFFYSITTYGINTSDITPPAEIDAYTMAGVYLGYTLGPGAFNNTLANGSMLYISGSSSAEYNVLGTATISAYDLNGNLQKSISLAQGSAYGMAFGPNGEIYVAMSSPSGYGAKGPVRLDPSTGNVSWTGTDYGISVIYNNGKAILATGSNKLAIYDAATGGHLN